MSAMVEFLESGCLVADGEGQLWLGMGLPERSALPIENTLAVFSPDFFLDEKKPWHCFARREKVSLSQLVQEFSPQKTSSQKTEDVMSWQSAQQRPSAEIFQKLFASAKESFLLGTYQKIVPVLFEVAKFSMAGERKKSLITELLNFAEGWPLFVYGLWDEHRGIMGATPEILFESAEKETFRTMALAGTRLAGKSSSLLEDPKERLEHQVVVDGICLSLMRCKNVLVGKTEELVLPTLAHLHTPILFGVPPDSPDKIFADLVESLHPTPALGTFPREGGMQYLREMEKRSEVSRKRFGAPFGAIFPDGRMACYVAIRNLEWEQKDECQIGAGCGIISESRIEREWEEVLGKIGSTKKALGIL